MLTNKEISRAREFRALLVTVAGPLGELTKAERRKLRRTHRLGSDTPSPISDAERRRRTDAKKAAKYAKISRVRSR